MDVNNKLSIDTIIQIGLLVVAILGIFLTWWQLRRSVRSQRIQLLHEMSNELRSLHLKLMELTISIKDKKQEDTSQEYKTLVAEYLNYMEHLSLLINEKYIDDRIAKKIFNRLVVEDTPRSFQGALKEGVYKEYSKLVKRWSRSANMESQKPFWLNIRRDSGEVRLAISLGFLVVVGYSFKIAYNLILRGVAGEFKIVSDFSGWKLYFTSVSPGVIFGLFGILILIYGLPRTLKAL